jgi:hypothetical protein
VLAAVAMLVDVDGDRARNRAGSRSYNAILEEINVAQCSLNRDGAQTNAGAMVGEVTVLFWRRRWVPSASADNSEHRQRGRRSSGSWATTMRRRGQGEDRPGASAHYPRAHCSASPAAPRARWHLGRPSPRWWSAAGPTTPGRLLWHQASEASPLHLVAPGAFKPIRRCNEHRPSERCCCCSNRERRGREEWRFPDRR